MKESETIEFKESLIQLKKAIISVVSIFPEGYDSYDFIKNSYESVLRNPLIANVLYLSKEIEKRGSGFKRICPDKGGFWQVNTK